MGKAATISKGASLPRGSAPEVSAPRSASVYVKPKLQENYSEPPAQLKVFFLFLFLACFRLSSKPLSPFFKKGDCSQTANRFNCSVLVSVCSKCWIALVDDLQFALQKGTTSLE